MKAIIDYYQYEVLKFRRQMNNMIKLPLFDRKEGAKILLNHINNENHHFQQSVEWLVDGSYGYGGYIEAIITLNNKRLNRRAWLFNTVAAVEYCVDGQMACRLWKGLDDATKDRINVILDAVIENYENDEEKNQHVPH